MPDSSALSLPWLDLRHGDALTVLGALPEESVNCCVTSPPYWGLRDYGVAGQLGLEATPNQYVAKLVDVFREVRRVLRDDGTLWLNLGDSYASGRSGQNGDLVYHSTLQGGRPASLPHKGAAGLEGLKPKDLLGIPWMVAFALRADGWYLRSDIIWNKPNPMPESVVDRPTKAHEYLFLLSKSATYWYDADAIREAVKPESLERAEYGFIDRYNKAASGGHRGAFGGNGVWGGKNLPAGKNHTGDPGPNGHKRLVEHVKEARAMGADHDNPLGPGGRNKRSVWEIPTQAYPEAHFATFPEALVKPCILAGCPEGRLVLDPFLGSGTTALVANQLGRRAIGIELNPAYLALAQKRCNQVTVWEGQAQA